MSSDMRDGTRLMITIRGRFLRAFLRACCLALTPGLFLLLTQILAPLGNSLRKSFACQITLSFPMYSVHTWTCATSERTLPSVTPFGASYSEGSWHPSTNGRISIYTSVYTIRISSCADVVDTEDGKEYEKEFLREHDDSGCEYGCLKLSGWKKWGDKIREWRSENRKQKEICVSAVSCKWKTREGHVHIDINDINLLTKVVLRV